MDESLSRHTPLLTPEGHEPEGGVDYTPAIEHVLDGYAPDGDSWLAARDTFTEHLTEHGSVDAAARTALATIADGAETSYEEADTKFWNYVEGEDGPHARYGDAITRALDGYAPDGDSWLAARDTFFDAIRHGAAPSDALVQSLDTVHEGAESMVGDAVERFEESVSTEHNQLVPQHEELAIPGPELARFRGEMVQYNDGWSVLPWNVPGDVLDTSHAGKHKWLRGLGQFGSMAIIETESGNRYGLGLGLVINERTREVYEADSPPDFIQIGSPAQLPGVGETSNVTGVAVAYKLMARMENAPFIDQPSPFPALSKVLEYSHQLIEQQAQKGLPGHEPRHTS